MTATEVAAARAIARLGRAAERALGDLSLAHYRVLSAIASGDERASRVAAKFSLGKPAISASVDALCRNGLLIRSVADDDQRATELALTDDGKRVLERAEEGLVAMLRNLAAHDRHTHAIVDALAAVGNALEDDARARGVGSAQRAAAGAALSDSSQESS